MGWLAGYSKYKVLTITGGASGAQANFQLKLAVSYEAAMQGDFDDLRFTQADGTTLVDAWAEVIVTDTSATVWVEFPTTPANTVEQIYRMYYGNAGAASDWDGDATFLFYDDFPGDTLDAGKWDNPGSGSYSITDGILSWTGADKRLYTDNTYPSDTAIRTSLKCATTGDVYAGFGYHIRTTADVIDVIPPYSTNQGYTSFNKASSASGAVYMTAASGDVTAFNTWDVLRYSDEVIIKLKDVVELDYTNTTYIPTIDLYGSIYRYNTDINIDWFLIRKHVANPPTYAFGAEQSVPPGEAAPTSIFYGPFVGPFGGPL